MHGAYFLVPQPESAVSLAGHTSAVQEESDNDSSGSKPSSQGSKLSALVRVASLVNGASRRLKTTAAFARAAAEAAAAPMGPSITGVEHPLITHAPEVVESIKFIRLAYFQELLLDESTLLPRCQDIPETAFGQLSAKSMLVSISHGWFFQCHPDPLGDKRQPLLEMLNKLRAKYPVAEIFVFFDFTGVSQRPYKLGQKQRTPEMQATFERALSVMHFCYCYSDVVIHLHSEPPAEDAQTFTTTVNLSKFELTEVGTAIQVVGLHEHEVKDGLTAFDIIHKINGEPVTSLEEVPDHDAEVRYLKRPFGKANLIPVDDRGWVYLERFITMLKAAMIDEDVFDSKVITNTEGTRTILFDGAKRMRHAAQAGDDELKEALEGFKDELRGKKFSAASTDKIIIDARNKTGGDASSASLAKQSPMSEDARIVAGLMDKLVNTLKASWQEEQEKQQSQSCRFKVHVPLLNLKPRPLRQSIVSVEPAIVLGIVAMLVLLSAGLVVAIGVAVLAMTAEAVVVFCVLGCLTGWGIALLCISPQHDVGLPMKRVVLSYVPVVLLGLSLASTGLASSMEVDARWQYNGTDTYVFWCTLIIQLFHTKIVDIFACFRSSMLQKRYRTHGWPLPNVMKKFKKGSKLGFYCTCVVLVVNGYLQGCVRMRAVIKKQSLPSAVAIVVAAGILKKLILYIIVIIVMPALKADFSTTDCCAFFMNATLSFGTCLLVMSFSDTTPIFVISLSTSCLDMAASVFLLHITHKSIKTMDHNLRTAQSQADQLVASQLLLKARTKMSTEVISLINELFIEFYSTAAAVTCGVTFRSSKVVTLLNAELSWEELPMFAAAHYLPNFFEGWLILIYLRYLGVDWVALARSIRVDFRFPLAKLTATIVPVLYVIRAAIHREE